MNIWLAFPFPNKYTQAVRNDVQLNKSINIYFLKKANITN